jgi:hypothetical protein
MLVQPVLMPAKPVPVFRGIDVSQRRANDDSPLRKRRLIYVFHGGADTG